MKQSPVIPGVRIFPLQPRRQDQGQVNKLPGADAAPGLNRLAWTQFAIAAAPIKQANRCRPVTERE